MHRTKGAKNGLPVIFLAYQIICARARLLFAVSQFDLTSQIAEAQA